MNAGKVWIVGGGLAGLSAAVVLAGQGVAVELIEGAGQVGGRCRSYVDPVLDMTIDNGNHLVLSGNSATFAYLGAIGSADRMAGPEVARFDFQDVRTGQAWVLQPNEGPLAWWVMAESRRVPGTRTGDYLALLALLNPAADKRINQVIPCKGPLWERLLQPFLLAVLNTDPATGSAALAGAVIRETLARGGRAYRPRIAQPSLAAALLDPALTWLAAKNVPVRLGQRVRAIRYEGGRAAALSLPDGEIALGPHDSVVVATPPWISQTLVPDLTVPDRFTPIVNAHFKLAPPAGVRPMVGVIGGKAEWVFAFEDRISVTVSGAEALVDTDREALAEMFWNDIRAVHGLGNMPIPPWQIVKERRATFEATPEQDARRPDAKTRWNNLILAGDWTRTGLPATIEGAIRSGQKAARLAERALV
ncbi:hydroxysqualene dehydroxylase HpnE [Phenylobacterium montanum]|uniref:Hydroxysqualene dehydroxylase HpnE n=1 Tax=Phenylobacterium montanum TaxID=2823693 RepID=A0A975IUK9_9CAUL|nr:hydroxysqualene dehydroxylase HpnE [Caulobacter sp. S6]QUD87903.1 hydroxysqualene dehydroxylase HpnE [Caulobacter sp. S6]